jgi:hypothetical protein
MLPELELVFCKIQMGLVVKVPSANVTVIVPLLVGVPLPAVTVNVRAVSLPATVPTDAEPLPFQFELRVMFPDVCVVPLATLIRLTVVTPVSEGAETVGPVAKTILPPEPVVPSLRSAAATCVHVSAVADPPEPRDLRYFGVVVVFPARRVPAPDVPPMIRSPSVVMGESALKLLLALVCPVPPFAMASVPVIVPSVTGEIPPGYRSIAQLAPDKHELRTRPKTWAPVKG